MPRDPRCKVPLTSRGPCCPCYSGCARADITGAAVRIPRLGGVVWVGVCTPLAGGARLAGKLSLLALGVFRQPRVDGAARLDGAAGRREAGADRIAEGCGLARCRVTRRGAPWLSCPMWSTVGRVSNPQPFADGDPPVAGTPLRGGPGPSAATPQDASQRGSSQRCAATDDGLDLRCRATVANVRPAPSGSPGAVKAFCRDSARFKCRIPDPCTRGNAKCAHAVRI